MSWNRPALIDAGTPSPESVERARREHALAPLGWLAFVATSTRPLPERDEIGGVWTHDPLSQWAEASRVTEAAGGGHAARRDARRQAEALLPDALDFAGDLLAALRDTAAQVRGRTPVQAGPNVVPAPVRF
jgi:hypothetical protein